MILLTPKNIEKATKFLARKWRERARERGHDLPCNLSGACKFVALFTQEVFGGDLEANWKHTWVRLNGEVLDLTGGVDSTHYVKDRSFMRRREFKESLDSCRPRVAEWARLFREEVENELAGT